jgi:hypothetical protein
MKLMIMIILYDILILCSHCGSAFGHVDVSASIRLGSQHIPIHDAHIRFERSTESKAKDAATVERVSYMHTSATTVAIDKATFYDSNADGDG